MSMHKHWGGCAYGADCEFATIIDNDELAQLRAALERATRAHGQVQATSPMQPAAPMSDEYDSAAEVLIDEARARISTLEARVAELTRELTDAKRVARAALEMVQPAFEHLLTCTASPDKETTPPGPYSGT